MDDERIMPEGERVGISFLVNDHKEPLVAEIGVSQFELSAMLFVAARIGVRFAVLVFNPIKGYKAKSL